MTRDELSVRLRTFFENDVYYSSDDINNSIQDGYDEICAFTGLILKATQITLAANKTYYDMITDVASDYIGIIAMFNHTTKRWMWPTSILKLTRHRDDWNTCIGTPEYFSVISHRYCAIFRKPGDALTSVDILYAAAAPILAGSDTIQISDDFIKVLEDYSITDLLEQQQEWNKAGRQLESYTNKLEKLRVWAQNQRSNDRLKSL